MEQQGGWISVINQDDETCFPFAVVEVIGHDDDTELAIITRPTENSKTAAIYFNGFSAIAPGEAGQVYRTFPAHAAYYVDTDGHPRVGQAWGTKAGSWFLHANHRGFSIQADSNTGVCAVVKGDPSEDTSQENNFWAMITNRIFTTDAVYMYEFMENEPIRRGQWANGQRRTTLGGYVVVTKTAEGNGVDVRDAFSITVVGAASGNFKLTLDSSETAAIAWNASQATIQAALEAASSVTFSTPFVVNSDYASHDITWSTNDLKPDTINPLYDVQNRKMAINQRYRIWTGYDATPTIEVTQTTTSDGVATADVWAVVITDVAGGGYVMSLDADDTATIPWDATQSEIQAITDTWFGSGAVAISGWSQDANEVISYTVTSADTEEHTLSIDDSLTKPATDYRFRGDHVVDDCGASLGDVTSISGYVPGVSQVLRKDADGCYYWETPEECI